MNVRVKDPVYHVVLSWPSDESPTDEEAFECGRHALRSVDMADHQYVFGVHRDTENIHLHIAVNRVHPGSYRAVFPDRDYFKLDRAMRELELRFGWRHDSGPLAVVDRNGVKVVDWTSATQNSKGRRPTRAADMERNAGHESLFTYARGEPRKMLINALSNPDLTWQQLHNLMSKYRLELREKGRGFAIFDQTTSATTPIKASDMHEDLSKSRLSARLGSFQPPMKQLEAVSAYDKFREPLRDQDKRDARSQDRANERRRMREAYLLYRKSFVNQRLDAVEVRTRYRLLREESRRQRAKIKAMVSSPSDRKAFYSIIAFEAIKARDKLQREISAERVQLKSDPRNASLVFSQWVEREAAQGNQAAISHLRGRAYAKKRNDKTESDRQSQSYGFAHPGSHEPNVTVVPDGFIYKVRRDGSVGYNSVDGQQCFRDFGSRVVLMLEAQDKPTAIRGALNLAVEKYGSGLELSGPPEFKRAVVNLMVENRVDVALADPELERLRKEAMEGVGRTAVTNRPSRRHK